jgi:hypothetical protein
MREVNGTYSQSFNRRYGRVGHVLQGRYKAILIDKDAYLTELQRYIVLNPVRAGLCGGACEIRGQVLFCHMRRRSVGACLVLNALSSRVPAIT